jgi:hypothetical protein
LTAFFPFNVTVMVAANKLGARSSAVEDLGVAADLQGAALVSGILAAASFEFPWLAAGCASAAASQQLGAFIAQQAAQGQANQANDPPVPDFLTREELEVKVIQTSEMTELAKSDPALSDVVHASVYLLAAWRTLDATQAKLNAADLAGDRAGERIQKSTCGNLAREFERKAKELQGIFGKWREQQASFADQLMNSVTEAMLVDLKNKEKQWRAHGFPKKEMEKLTDGKVPFNISSVVKSLNPADILHEFIVAVERGGDAGSAFFRGYLEPPGYLDSLVARYALLVSYARQLAHPSGH